MKTTVSIPELMDELDLEELGVRLDKAPIGPEQVMENLTKRGVLTARALGKKRRPLRLAALGGYVTEVGQSVTAGDYTLTVENCLIDENGVGAIAYTVACPEGLPQINAFDDMLPVGQYTADDESGSFLVTVKTRSGVYLDHYDILNAAETTDTVLHGVYYFQSFAFESGESLTTDDALLVSLNTRGADGTAQESPNTIEISAANRVPSVSLTCGDLTAELSPLSLVINPLEGSEEPWIGAASRERVIRYRDGGEYVLDRSSEEEAEQNMISHGINGYTWEDMTVFNRFVDTAKVVSVTVTASDGAQYIFEPAA